MKVTDYMKRGICMVLLAGCFSGCPNPSDGGSNGGSNGGGGSGGGSTPTGYNGLPTFTLSDVQPSLLQAGTIRLDWAADGRSGGTYTVYRCTQADFKVNVQKFENISTNSYVDSNCTDDTPYFYLIGYNDNTKNFIMDRAPVLGLKHSTITDLQEPNNTQATAIELTVGAAAVTSVLYAVKDAALCWATDDDWYCVNVPAEKSKNNATYTVTVTQDDEKPLNGKIQFQFKLDSTSAPQCIETTPKIFTFSDFGRVDRDRILYFKVSADSNGLSNNTYAGYSIQVTTGL